MKKARILRLPSTEQGTIGVFTFGAESLRCLELPWKDNIKQQSCIPPGTYKCVWARSPRFGMVYHVQDVPGRSNVLIHPANFAGDTNKGWTTELQGCIAPCLRIGRIPNRVGIMQLAGLVSRPAVERLHSWGNKESFELEIT